MSLLSAEVEVTGPSSQDCKVTGIAQPIGLALFVVPRGPIPLNVSVISLLAEGNRG